MEGRIVRGDQLVIPGDKVAVIEEFEPKSGFYENSGIVRAYKIGYPRFDMDNRVVSLEDVVGKPVIPKPGDSAYCRVTQVEDRIAVARILKLAGKEKVFQPPFIGVIQVSNVRHGKTLSVREWFKPGDLVYASILSYCNFVYHLSTKGPGYGVVLARCSKCYSFLERRSYRLICPSCNIVEQRKISRYYGSLRTL